MQLGIIGLGRMGGNIARRLMLNGHTTVVYDRNTAFVDTLAAEGASGVIDLLALVAGLAKPRAVWVMLPAGAPTEDTIDTLSTLLEAGDTIIDGGNAVLAGFGQVVRQQQQALGTQTLGFLSVFDGLAGGTADTGQDWHAGRAGIDGGLDDLRILAGGQGEEFTGATGCEQGRGAVRGQPLEALDVAVAIEIALGSEIGDRERQQARREDGLQFLWIHYSNTLGRNVCMRELSFGQKL